MFLMIIIKVWLIYKNNNFHLDIQSKVRIIVKINFIKKLIKLKILIILVNLFIKIINMNINLVIIKTKIKMIWVKIKYHNQVKFLLKLIMKYTKINKITRIFLGNHHNLRMRIYIIMTNLI
jgi:hypothetical protein